MESPWMNSKQAADYMGLKSKTGFRTVLMWVKEGRIHAGKAGSFYRFTTDMLDNFLVLNNRKRRK